ncbi:putative manganese transporter [Rhodospira trueperi]|uniref:Putative, 10TM heavy-metal exporter n=1 Tax=Rhodospira trueperi TaxID=69960 RepID=A0A1G7BIH5_9PROT|nr:putative manganese transporter [Rhodospira trueperi]SDE26732.1 Putative, 10TM heavy-metal exporter [Rhodospira trueperi]
MTTLIAAIRRPVAGLPFPGRGRIDLTGPGRRALALAVLAGITLSVPNGTMVLLDVLSEAYLAVAVFVAGTLVLLGVAERALGTDLGSVLRRHARWQVPIAAALGAFPGCGGAIVAITQYTRGHLSMGGVVATLTATMGDAMFLLLAQAPDIAALVLAVSVVVGVLSGWIVDAIHGPGFMRPREAASDAAPACRTDESEGGGTPVAIALERAWLLLLGPGLALGVLLAFQVDVDAWLASVLGVAPGYWLGVVGAAGALALWVLQGRGMEAGGCSDVAPRKGLDLKPVVATTSFVTAWVVFAFAGYQLIVAGLGLDLSVVFQTAAPLVPAIAVLVGLIPGCGPQILVTTLYLSGVAPLSAQMGNALANDGDALFPAIAVAPRAALVATAYSAVPAVLVGYGTYALVG